MPWKRRSPLGPWLENTELPPAVDVSAVEESTDRRRTGDLGVPCSHDVLAARSAAGTRGGVAPLLRFATSVHAQTVPTQFKGRQDE